MLGKIQSKQTRVKSTTLPSYSLPCLQQKVVYSATKATPFLKRFPATGVFLFLVIPTLCDLPAAIP